MHCVCMHRSGTEHRLPLRDLVVCRQRLCGVPSPRSTSVPGRMGCHGINATARRVRGCAVVLGSHWQGVATAAGQHVSCLLKGSVDFACTHDDDGPGGRDNTGVAYTRQICLQAGNGPLHCTHGRVTQNPSSCYNIRYQNIHSGTDIRWHLQVSADINAPSRHHHPSEVLMRIMNLFCRPLHSCRLDWYQCKDRSWQEASRQAKAAATSLPITCTTHTVGRCAHGHMVWLAH